MNPLPSHTINLITSTPPDYYPNTYGEPVSNTHTHTHMHTTNTADTVNGDNININSNSNNADLKIDVTDRILCDMDTSVEFDELSPLANGYGSISSGDSVNNNNKGILTIKGEKKLKKKQVKQNQDTLKFDMGQERTFFKWLRTGMQVGAIGTFVFIALDHKRGSPLGIATVAFAWLVGFVIVLYGLWSYYARREALRNGSLPAIPEFIRHHAPSFVVLALIAVVSSALAYAAFANKGPQRQPRVPYPNPPSTSTSSNGAVSGVLVARSSLK